MLSVSRISAGVLLLTLASGVARAAPAILTIDDTTLGHGQTGVTLTGVGFGAKARAAPLRFDDFSDGVAGQPLKGEAAGGWRQQTNPVTYQTTKLRGLGKLSAFQDFTSTYTRYLGLGSATIPAGTTTMYVSGWFNFEIGGAPSRNIKIMSFAAGTRWQSRIDTYNASYTDPLSTPTCGTYRPNDSGHLYAYDGCDSQTSGANNWQTPFSEVALPDGDWHRIESYLDLGSASGGGYRDVYVDAALLATISGRFIDGDCWLDGLLIGHYFARDCGTPTPWAKRYWSELYVDTTRARIEIGNSSSWSTCTHREVQVATAWDNTSIVFRVNQGSLPAGQAYVFVVDATGTASAGYPITLGSPAGPDPDASITLDGPSPARDAAVSADVLPSGAEGPSSPGELGTPGPTPDGAAETDLDGARLESGCSCEAAPLPSVAWAGAVLLVALAWGRRRSGNIRSPEAAPGDPSSFRAPRSPGPGRGPFAPGRPAGRRQRTARSHPARGSAPSRGARS